MQKICNATECLWAPLSINLDDDDDDVKKYRNPVTPMYISLSGFAKQKVNAFSSLSQRKKSGMVFTCSFVVFIRS